MKEEYQMGIEVKSFISGNITKYVFYNDEIVYEAVLYRYKERTVICCSVQSGCPVGCTFCGTGKKFIGNLSASGICWQIRHILQDSTPDGRFQIMFMSMGEPFLNWSSVSQAIKALHLWYPTAELLISTIAPRQIYYESIIALSEKSQISAFNSQSINQQTSRGMYLFHTRINSCLMRLLTMERIGIKLQEESLIAITALTVQTTLQKMHRDFLLCFRHMYSVSLSLLCAVLMRR